MAQRVSGHGPARRLKLGQVVESKSAKFFRCSRNEKGFFSFAGQKLDGGAHGWSREIDETAH